MIDNRTASAIDQALQKHHTPVGDLFAATRHGRVKRCFSRGTAISWLAHFLTSHAFECSGFQQRHPDVKVLHHLHGEAIQRGAMTCEYLMAHQRCIRRLRRILARKREMQKWCKKWDAMHDRYIKEVEELQASKPIGIQN